MIPDDNVRCVVCGQVAIGERLVGMVGDKVVVELVCYDHLPNLGVEKAS